jgi:phage-related protein (TIGR01555 family)
MLKKIFNRLFSKKVAPAPVSEGRPEVKTVDPLDPIQRMKAWTTNDRQEPSFGGGASRELNLRKVSDFPVFDGLAGQHTEQFVKSAMDSASNLKKARVIVDDDGGFIKGGPNPDYGVPNVLQNWYMSQGFIGYQSCAIIAQHWLVDKACSMAGEDAARNGWVVKSRGGKKLTDEQSDLIKQADKKYKLKENLIELNRFKNIFGIRVAILKVKSSDPLYYEKPFNLDGVTEGSYEGISQVDPYWMMPVMTSKGTGDPSSIGFYDPEYWVISGKKYHKSHLVIVRGSQPADILKPTYIFGGVSMVQRIYERVYAAERTANESPLMAMSKRTMAIHVDMEKALADQASFEQRLLTWLKYRDNHGVKVLGREEQMEQFDINLSDFDSIIMNQYQIVAAIARLPATKILGTSPKGFNATGEFEMRSYHEELESTQEHVFMPLLERHYDVLARSLGLNDLQTEVVCNAVDSMTAKERAELNYSKAQTYELHVNLGAISPDEVRDALREDPHSGYNELAEVDANTEPGMSPDIIAELQKAGAAEEKGSAAEATAGISPNSGAIGHEDDDAAIGSAAGVTPETMKQFIPFLLTQMLQAGIKGSPAAKASSQDPMTLMLLMLMSQLMNKDVGIDNVQPPIRGTRPSTMGVAPSTVGIHHKVGSISADGMAADWNPRKLPKMRFDGLPLSIENPRGTIRAGIDLTGTPWQVKMAHHYGYINGYMGPDGDEVDCFVGPDMRSREVYVISQSNPDGEFDEYKCMLGFPDESTAVQGYRDSFSRDWDGLSGVQRMSIDDFKNWLDAGECSRMAETKPE